MALTQNVSFVPRVAIVTTLKINWLLIEGMVWCEQMIVIVLKMVFKSQLIRLFRYSYLPTSQ